MVQTPPGTPLLSKADPESLPEDSALCSGPIPDKTTAVHGVSTAENSTSTNESHPVHASTEHKTLALLAELVYYKTRCEKAEQECINMQKARRQTAESLNMTQAEFSKVLNQRTRRIDSQQRMIDDRVEFKQYLAIGTANGSQWDKHSFLRQFQVLKLHISTLPIVDITRKAPLEHIYSGAANVVELFSTLFDKDEQNTIPEHWEELSGVTMFEFIQALIGAAIYHWILSAEFSPHTTMATPLLERYRKQIAALCKYRSRGAHRLVTD